MLQEEDELRIDNYIQKYKEMFDDKGNKGRFPNPIVVPSVMSTKLGILKDEIYEYLLDSPLVTSRPTIHPTETFQIL